MTDARHALLAGIVDYAGLFPPAVLGMPEATANYASYRASDDGWMLGRFVVPVARLSEFALAAVHAEQQLAATDAVAHTPPPPWLLSAIAGADIARDVGAVRSFNDRHRPQFVVDVLEAKAGDRAAIAAIAEVVPQAGLVTYVEIPLADDPAPLVEALAAHALRAKLRTGGVTPDAFPSSAQVARALARCVSARVPCKATAGLHHPVRGDFALTYAANAPRGMMFGYLNVFLAAGLLTRGGTERDAEALLSDADPHAFSITDDDVRWREHVFSRSDLARLRAAATAFGSCSFRAPVDDLGTLVILQSSRALPA